MDDISELMAAAGPEHQHLVQEVELTGIEAYIAWEVLNCTHRVTNGLTAPLTQALAGLVADGQALEQVTDSDALLSTFRLVSNQTVVPSDEKLLNQSIARRTRSRIKEIALITDERTQAVELAAVRTVATTLAEYTDLREVIVHEITRLQHGLDHLRDQARQELEAWEQHRDPRLLDAACVRSVQVVLDLVEEHANARARLHEATTGGSQ